MATWILIALSATLLLIAEAAPALPPVGPRDAVEAAVSRFMNIQNGRSDDAGGAAGRSGKIRAIVREMFDFDEISRRALSRHWPALQREEQAEFVTLFQDLLERAYLSGRRVEPYGDPDAPVYVDLLVEDLPVPVRITDVPFGNHVKAIGRSVANRERNRPPTDRDQCGMNLVGRSWCNARIWTGDTSESIDKIHRWYAPQSVKETTTRKGRSCDSAQKCR